MINLYLWLFNRTGLGHFDIQIASIVLVWVGFACLGTTWDSSSLIFKAVSIGVIVFGLISWGVCENIYGMGSRYDWRSEYQLGIEKYSSAWLITNPNGSQTVVVNQVGLTLDAPAVSLVLPVVSYSGLRLVPDKANNARGLHIEIAQARPFSSERVETLSFRTTELSPPWSGRYPPSIEALGEYEDSVREVKQENGYVVRSAEALLREDLGKLITELGPQHSSIRTFSNALQEGLSNNWYLEGVSVKAKSNNWQA